MFNDEVDPLRLITIDHMDLSQKSLLNVNTFPAMLNRSKHQSITCSTNRVAKVVQCQIIDQTEK